MSTAHVLGPRLTRSEAEGATATLSPRRASRAKLTRPDVLEVVRVLHYAREPITR